MAKPANMGTRAAARVRSTRPTARSGSDPAAPGPRRMGSISMRKSGTSNSTGAPMMMNAACQGARLDSGGRASAEDVVSHCNRLPPPIKARPWPTGALMRNPLTGRPNRSDGNRSLSIDSAAGVRLASPTATPMRVRNSCVKLRARPEAIANKLNSPTPAAMIMRRDTGPPGARWACRPARRRCRTGCPAACRNGCHPA